WICKDPSGVYPTAIAAALQKCTRGGRGRSRLPPSALIGDICGSSPDLHWRRVPWLIENPQMAGMGADGKQAKGLCPCSRDFTAEDAEDGGGRADSAALHLR